MWSEERQASIIGATISAAMASGFSAVVLWQFADCRVDPALFAVPSLEELPGLPEPLLNVSESAEWMERLAVGYQITNSPFGFHQALRPRNLNNKGLVSISRQHKKLSFYTAQAGFRLCDASVASVVPGVPLAPASEELVEVRALEQGGCPGCHLAVHTWNVADRPPGEAGVRVHGHRLAQRRSRWGLRRGFLRLAGHADGRSTALGGFLTVSGAGKLGISRGSRGTTPNRSHPFILLRGRVERRGTSSDVSVREAAMNLWRWEAAPGREGVMLRVIAGEMCGTLLSLQGAERDENSVYAMVHMDPSLATIFHLQHV